MGTLEFYLTLYQFSTVQISKSLNQNLLNWLEGRLMILLLLNGSVTGNVLMNCLYCQNLEMFLLCTIKYLAQVVVSSRLLKN